MKTILSLLLLTIPLFTNAQPNNKVVIGTIDTISSKILNEKRPVWVYIPHSGPNDNAYKQRYPVVYVLDGEANFYSVVGMIQQLSAVNGNTICPEMIVVGIPNTERRRDLTPTCENSDLPLCDSIFGHTTGGGEQFISFIEKELMPHIDSVYPTEPYKMLIGHSLGGLLAMDVLINHTPLFNAYIAIDPSMWWDHQKLLKEAKTALSTQKYPGTSLFLGIANTMANGMDTTIVKMDTTEDTKHIRSILELKHYLSSDKQDQLKSKAKYYPDEDHSSVALMAEYDGLHFIFDSYHLSLTDAEENNIDEAVISKIENHFAAVSKQLVYTVKVPESMANDIGNEAVKSKHFAAAEYLLKLNVTNYPESANAYSSLGDLYLAKGDKDNAAVNYKKSLAIREVPKVRRKLESL